METGVLMSNQRIYKAIQKVSEREPLFTSIITRLIPREDNSVSTMGTDGEKLIYSPTFVNSLSEDELAGSILHETLHCAFRHIWRREKRNQSLWNIASDFAVNEVVNEIFPLPKGSLRDSKYYGMSAEMIYELLNKKRKGILKGQTWCDHGEWEGKQKGSHKNEESEGSPKSSSFFEEVRNKVFGKSSNKESYDEKEERKEYQNRQLEGDWENMFRRTILKNYGKLPDSIKRVVEKLYYIPVIDWSVLVKNILSEDTTDYSFTHPDRRFLESDFVLPGPYSIDKLENVVFCYDTSGSINNSDLFAFYLETLSLLDNFSSFKGWAAVCDAYLHSFKEIDAKSTFNDSDFVGGGGTNFRPPFGEIERRQLNPKAVFYFTDTYGSFPDNEPPYPVYWLVRSEVGDMEERRVPFGTVVKFLPKY